METVGILHDRIIKKLEILRQLNPNLVNNLHQRYMTMSSEYIMAHIDAEMNSCSEQERELIHDQYVSFLTNEEIREQIDKFANIIFSKATPIMAPLIHSFKQIGETQNFVKINSNRCACGGLYQLRPSMSDMICQACGNVEIIEGLYFENQDTTRNTPYRPSKHCQVWVARIFGIERDKIPEEIKDKVKDCMNRDNVKYPNCELIRQYLKEIKMTKYNNHVVKIRREITGIGPPTPSDQQLNNIYTKYSQIDDFYTKVKTDKEKSRRYYPCFIRKAIEMEYENRPKDRDMILEGIHLQDKATTERNDEIYEKICLASGGVLKFSITKPVVRI